MTDDYTDHMVDKIKVKKKAEWYDVKFLVRKQLSLSEHQVRATRFISGNWDGWLVDIHVDADISKLVRGISKCSVVGKRTVFIGIVE